MCNKTPMLNWPFLLLFSISAGELTDAVGGVYDVSNLDRLGSSEVEQVNRVIEGVKLIIQMEKRLEKGESIDDLIPA